jgi:DNA-binding transcriptional LysR family regulator
MAIPRFAAEKLAAAADLRIFPLPFSIRTFEVKIYSHKRSGQRGATRWLKEELQTLAQALHSGLSGSQERMSPG